MVSLHYDDNLLIQYLLGGLPEEQVEEFDRLSVVDSEFASRLGEVENDLFDAYVQGALTGQIRAQFESRNLNSPRRRENVKFAQALQTFAEAKVRARAVSPAPIVAESAVEDHSAPEPELVRQAASESRPWWRAVRSLFTVPNLALQWGLATAALLMLLGGGWLLVDTMRVRRQTDAAQAALKVTERALLAQIEEQRSANAKEAERLRGELHRTQEKLAQLEQQRARAEQQARPPASPAEPAIVAFDLSPRTRGAARATTLAIPPRTDFILLQLEVASDAYVAYRAELRTETDDQLIWKSGRLTARDRGDARIVDLRLRAKLLAPRGYSINLKRITESGKAEDDRSYTFRVVMQ